MKPNRFLPAILAVVCLNLAAFIWAAEKPGGTQPAKLGLAANAKAASPAPVWDMATLSRTPEVFPSPDIRSTNEQIQALFFAGPAYHGQPTRIFAWLGQPKLPPGRKAPGMVLIHGGGGTAFESWVKFWVDRGYAAIAMDTCGALPVPLNAKPRPRHEHGGPPGWGGFDQLQEPMTDQWAYHAVSAAILAHSLLRNQPGVDAGRIGVTGISWGGYLTCIVSGVDPRLKFAVPVYGCGDYRETIFGVDRLSKLPPEQSAQWYQHWEPTLYLPSARIPMLWVNGSNDHFFWPPAWQNSYRQIPAAQRTLALRLRMPHGQGQGESAPEITAFADSIVRGGEPLAMILDQKKANGTLTIHYRSARLIVRAELNYTADAESPWEKREWKTVPATVQPGVVTADLPADAKLYFANLIDDRGCVVSTEHELNH